MLGAKEDLFPVHTIGPLVIDERRWIVTLHDREVRVTRTEMALLVFLAEDPDRVFKREDIMLAVWGGYGSLRTLDSTCCRLRKKLDRGWLQNIWGVGYRLAPVVLEPVAAAA